MEHPGEQNRYSRQLSVEGEYIDNITAWREFVQELKREWKHLWWTRIDDKYKAEGVASDEFPRLFIDRGTVIIATKDYKPPNLHEILMHYMPEAILDKVNPNHNTGGIGKFIREIVRGQRTSRKKTIPKAKKPKNQQQKHGGRGWLHYNME